jgi:hypothetical protein
MGIAVLSYLFITGAFLQGSALTLWQDVIQQPLDDIGISIQNFGIFIAVCIIFVFIIIVPLLIFAIRTLS